MPSLHCAVAAMPAHGDSQAIWNALVHDDRQLLYVPTPKVARSAVTNFLRQLTSEEPVDLSPAAAGSAAL